MGFRRSKLESTSPLRFSRALCLAMGIATMSALGASLTACGPDAPPPPPPKTAAEIDELKRIEKSKALVADAKRAMKSKSYDKARKQLRAAAELNVESDRFEISQVTEEADKGQAKLWANEMTDRLKEKDCAGAFKDMANQMAELESETFTRELRSRVAAKALECLTAVVDDATLATRYADARTLVNAPETKAVLGAAAWKKMAAELNTTIIDALRSVLSDDLKAKRWIQVMAKLDDFVKKGDTDEGQAAELLADVRKALAPELEGMLGRAVGQRDAASTIRVADTLIKLVRWEALPPEAAEAAKDKALPAEIFKKREALGAWVEGQRAAMKIDKKPEKRWTHGKVMLFPPSKIDGESKRDLPPATEVWVIAHTKDRSLITAADPGTGPLPTLFDKVVGWVPSDRLAPESTAEWLPPDDQLKGVRVWAPLRPPEMLYELGLVTDVQGKDISVKRVADDKVIKLTRKQLKPGKLAAGQKVLAFCTAKDQVATVEEMLADGKVRIKCEGGATKEEFLAGIRAKPELLPASK